MFLKIRVFSVNFVLAKKINPKSELCVTYIILVFKNKTKNSQKNVQVLQNYLFT